MRKESFSAIVDSLPLLDLNNTSIIDNYNQFLPVKSVYNSARNTRLICFDTLYKNNGWVQFSAEIIDEFDLDLI